MIKEAQPKHPAPSLAFAGPLGTQGISYAFGDVPLAAALLPIELAKFEKGNEFRVQLFYGLGAVWVRVI